LIPKHQQISIYLSKKYSNEGLENKSVYSAHSQALLFYFQFPNSLKSFRNRKTTIGQNCFIKTQPGTAGQREKVCWRESGRERKKEEAQCGRCRNPRSSQN
jgi:hypothetical protein